MNGDNRRRERKELGWATKKKKLIWNVEEELESKLGFSLFTEGDKRLGWLLTFAPVNSPFYPSFLLSFHPPSVPSRMERVK